MISLRGRPETGWNLVFALSLVAIVASLGFTFLRPNPSSVSRRTTSAAQIDSQRQTVLDQLRRSHESVAARTWTVTPEVFGSQVLDALNRLCGENHLQLAAFRVGKPFPSASLIQVPVTLVVEGAYPDVIALLQKVEEPDMKVAVSQVKISATNTGDRVSASLGLTGFLAREDK